MCCVEFATFLYFFNQLAESEAGARSIRSPTSASPSFLSHDISQVSVFDKLVSSHHDVAA